jgi:hypothetical protein
MWLPSPAGLRLETSCENDKKKMNFIFNFEEKIFLTKKLKRACQAKTKSVRGNSRANQAAVAWASLPRTDLISRFCAASPS